MVTRNLLGNGTINAPLTNIPELALAQQLAAIKNRELQRSIANEAQPQDIETLNTLMPITGSGTVNDPTTNIPGLGELQRSLAYEAQPQDAMTFSNRGDWLEQLGEWKVGDVEVGRRVGNLLVGGLQTFDRNILNWTGTGLSAIGRLSEGIFGGESSIKDAGTYLLNLDQDFAKAAQQAYYDVNHGKVDELAEDWHGSGTSLGFATTQLLTYLASLGAGAPVGLAALLAYAARNTHEALSEAGNAVSDLYALDKDRLDDALKGGLYSIAGNAPLDWVQNGLEGVLGAIGGGLYNAAFPNGGVISGLIANYLGGLAGQEFNELLQEPRQQATEQAVINTFKSGDMSLGNFWSNYKKEIGNFGNYFEQVAPSVASSTFITHNLMWPFGVAGGAYHTNRYNRDMRAKVPKAVSNLENSRTNLGQQRTTLLNDADTLDKQRSAILNDAYNLEQQADELRNNASNTSPSDYSVGVGVNSANEEMDTNPDYQYDAQTDDDVPILSRGEKLSRAEDMRSKAQSMRSQAEDMRSQAEKMRSEAEASLSQAKTLDEQLKILKEYAESKLSWWKADAPQELYEALGKGNPMSIFADDEGLKEDSTPETSPEQNTQSEEKTTTQRLVDDEPDIDLDEAKAQPNTATQQAEQNDTQLLPPSAQQNDDISSPFDNLNTASETNQNLVDDGENYHQSTQETQADINAGEFTFSTKGKSYSFGVASTHSNDTGSTGVAADRRMRYQGRRLEIRNSRGQVIATYHPYTGNFTFTPDMEKKHSSRWRNSFKNQFMSNANSYLGCGGFLDANGNLASDGNEAFRRAWDKRRKSDANSFYDDITYPEDAVSYEQPQTSTAQSGQAQTRKSSIIDRIRSIVNGEIYHQGETGAQSGNTGTQADANTFTVRTDKGDYSFTIRGGEFSDKQERHKKFWGRFLEFVDAKGNVIARVSPTLERMEFSKHAPKDSATRDAIHDIVNNTANLHMMAANNGFTIKNGQLVDNSDKEFRKKEFERWDKVIEAQYIAAWMQNDKNERERRAKMSFGARMKEDFIDDPIDSIKGIPDNLRQKWRKGKLGVASAAAGVAAGGRSAIYRAIQFAYDLVERGEGKEIRENIRDKLNAVSDKFIEAWNYDKKKARRLRREAREKNDAASRVIAAQIMYLASYTGNSAQELLKSRAFDIIGDPSQTGGFERDKEGNFTRDEFDNYKESNGDFVFVPEKKDSEGKVVDHAKNLIYFYREHNISTLIHEPGHFFLQVMRDLYRDGKLQGRALQDWKTLAKYLEIEDVDFKLLAKDEKDLTPEERAKWKEYRDKWVYAQEKFATSGEKFIMVGQAPKMKLRRAFEVLKRYMGRVYGSVGKIETMYGIPLRYDENGNPRTTTVDDVIRLVDADRQVHSYKITSEAMEFLSKVYGGTPKGEGNKTQSSTESVSGAGESETYHQSAPTHIRRSNDSFLTPECYDQLVYHATGHIILGNKFDLKYVGSGNGTRPLAWGFCFSDKQDDIRKYRRTGLEGKTGKGNIYIADIPENTKLLNWNAKIREQSNEVTKGLSRLQIQLRKSGINEALLSKLQSSKTGEEFYRTLETEIVPKFIGQSKFSNRGYRNDMVASLLLNQAGIPGLYYGNTYLGSDRMLKNNRNFIVWNTDMINLLGSAQDNDTANFIKNNSNTIMRADTFAYNENLTPEARRQMEAVRAKYYGTNQWMKAPNGKPTNLTEHQWLAVRTENFKKWFGDWENDPANASKILDENGEPLVVWHGTPTGGFSVFNTRGRGISKGSGSFFSSTRTGAEAYIQGKAKINHNLYPVFLNIRNPYVYDAQGRYWASLSDTWIEDRDGTRIYTKKDGTSFKNKYDAIYYIREVLKDDYRYQAVTGDRLNSTDDIIRAVWDGYMGDEDYDGVVIRNVLDGKGREPVDDYIIRTAEDIKSATNNNGEYSESQEIYKQSIISARDFTITPEARKQMEAVRKQYYGTSQWMKAPNGRDTNLTEQQWLAVRTENFKRWFGDWERDPANASKILDENGEPLVVYHGTPKGKDFSIFRTSPDGAHFGTYSAAYQRGMTMSGFNPEIDSLDMSDYLSEEDYEDYLAGDTELEDRVIDELFAPDIIPCFLNIRNPLRVDDAGDGWEDVIADAKEKGYDGLIYENRAEDKGYDSYVIFEPVQTKHSEKNNGNYDGTDGDFYHQSANFYITTKKGSAISPDDKHLDDATRTVIKEISEQINGTATPNVRNIIDKLRTRYTRLIDSSSDFIKNYEPELEQLKAKPFTPQLWRSITSLEGLLEGSRNRLQYYQDVLKTLDNISDISLGNVPPSKLASSLRDILNGTPKGTFEEDLAEPLSKEARKQMKAVYKKYAGTEQYLKAPNGKRSNLTERQWLAVRTPLFKAWFGDWENDPANASKVLDENGEPRVVYHGSPSAGFSEFDTSGQGNSYDTGAWFTSRLENGESYAGGDDGGVYAVFLNIRNPFVLDAAGRRWNNLNEIYIYDNETGYTIYDKDDGKPFASVRDAEKYISEGLGYDERDDPNVYPVDEDGYARYTPENARYTVEVNDEYSTTNEVVRGVFGGELSANNHDGVIFRDIYDTGATANMKLYLSDVFVVPTKSNIKSATGNNGNFDTANNEIYRQAARTLAKADPDRINFNNLMQGNRGFVSAETVERYHQDSLHGTGHTLEENRMKLSKVGTGEGGEYRGWGIYSGQTRAVAEKYRHYGLPRYSTGHKIFSITLKNGSVLRAENYFWSNNYSDTEIKRIFLKIDSIVGTGTPPDAKIIIETLHNYYSDALNNGGIYGLTQGAIEDILHIIDNISDIQISPKPKGNIYRLDVPENDIILNWDAALRNQPKHVREAIEKIKQFIYKQGDIYCIDTSNINNAKSGGALYMEIADVMQRYLEHYTPDDGIRDDKKRTSLLFNRFGVPGLRFLDGGSRGQTAGRTKTYNFVTWNEDFIKVLGIDPDSDQEAIEYFERYKAEHPDGFITPEAIERFDQLVTHATGNIILGNKFNLQYVGSGEGGDMFGYGAYFEQNRAVAEKYRRMGLKNAGFDKIDVRLSNGTVLSLTDIYTQLNNLRYNPDTKIKLPAKVSKSALADAIVELLHKKINSTSWDFNKTLEDLVYYFQREAYQLENEGRYNASDDRRAVAKALLAIKSMDFFGEKRGNIYQFDIPEDYELLDWDAALSKQPKQLMPIIRKLVKEINNNPAKFLAMGLARRFDNQKDMQAKLSAIISVLHDKAKGMFDKSRQYNYDEIIGFFEGLPEYKQLVDVVHAKATEVASLLYDSIHTPILMKHEGGELYKRLASLMYFGDVRDGTYEEEKRAANIAASMYLNSKGIPGHRFLDRGSRSDGGGTHNYVIWNMSRVKMIGIDPSSDQDAIDYYNRTKKLQDALAQADSEAYHQAVKNADEFTLTPEAQRQMEEVRTKYYGTSQWLKAPNGKQTKLTEQQWLAVRTPNFKRWFGDWINNPENASKVLDENGEPRVVWHGSPSAGIDVFRNNYTFFSSKELVSQTYGRNIYPVFVNLRNPYVMDAHENYWNNLDFAIYDIANDKLIYRPDGTHFTSWDEANQFRINVLGDSPFKSDGTPFTSVDSVHLTYNIQYDNEFTYDDAKKVGVRYTMFSEATDELVRGVSSGRIGSKNHDGVIIRNVIDYGAGTNGQQQSQSSGDGTKDSQYIADDFVIFINTQVKSATRNNGEYSPSDPNHYHQAMTAHVDTLKARLKNTTPRDIDINSTTAPNFVSDQYAERFDQRMYHGTGHIILGNGFDLKYLGSGEGSCYRGWGIYLGEANGVGEFYRKFGTPTPILTMKDGTQYSYDDLAPRKRKLTRGTDESYALSILKGILKGKSTTIDELRDYYSNSRRDEGMLNFIDNIADIWRTDKRGNIYEVEGPENDVLLDFDVALEEQPKHVKKAINKLKTALKRNPMLKGIDLAAIPDAHNGGTISLYDAETGLEFYFAISKAVLAHYLQERGMPMYESEMSEAEHDIEKKLWVEAKKATSLMFNEFGVPGLRFWDKASRDAQEGTHNFVIWNTDTLKIMGIDPSSDSDAIEYFRDTLAEADPDRMDFSNLMQGNRGFISDEAVERYHQDSLHGTGYTIKENRMMLSKVGFGEGGQYRGWGIYSAQARGVAETLQKVRPA